MGEIIINREMVYSATIGETLYKKWLNSFVATKDDFEIDEIESN